MTATLTCLRARAALDGYVEDRLSPAESGAVRKHLASCDACRSAAAEKDPLLHFSVLADEAPRAEMMEGFFEGVMDGIDREPMPRAPTRPMFAAWRATPAALAASVLIMIAAAAIVMRAPVETIRARGSVVAQGTAPERTAPVRRALSRPLPGTVEEVRTPDAREVQIYSMTWLSDDAADRAGTEGQVAELVLIVDAGLDLR